VSTMRVFELLDILSGGRLYGRPELARLLGVCTRTVSRDITVLRDCGFPIELDWMDNGGRGLVAAYQLVNPTRAKRLSALRMSA
jgi:predicted DNA-binding transcriptional regulator YafY